MIKEIEKWWNESSKWYQKGTKVGTKSAHYGPCAPDESELKLLGNVKGKKILEIGCGGGQCSIAFAKQGAKCTGIDLSREQLKFAEHLAKKNKVKIKFIRGDIQKLKGIKSNSYDIVFSAFALQYSPNLTLCFKQVHRVLKKNGIFVFSFDHPFYRVFSTKDLSIQKSYLKTGRYQQTEVGSDGKKHTFVAYNVKVSDIVNSLVEAKFCIEKMIEPLKLKWEWPKEWYPEKLVKIVPPTIIFKAVKK
ncbi:class I SAM-dependent methyltransferase [Candidatus Woesearchaeota archaeon]|nr:class I SAM-dependent methyltransferase [Candidatus Woesearchaeota archaeon]